MDYVGVNTPGRPPILMIQNHHLHTLQRLHEVQGSEDVNLRYDSPSSRENSEVMICRGPHQPNFEAQPVGHDLGVAKAVHVAIRDCARKCPSGAEVRRSTVFSFDMGWKSKSAFQNSLDCTPDVEGCGKGVDGEGVPICCVMCPPSHKSNGVEIGIERASNTVGESDESGVGGMKKVVGNVLERWLVIAGEVNEGHRS